MKCVYRLLILFIFLSVFTHIFYKYSSKSRSFTVDTLNLKNPPNSRFRIEKTAVFTQSGGETRFDQKWELPDRKLVSTWDELMEIGDFILLGNFSYSKGLGNLMFQYAAMIALAQKYQALLPISEENLLRRAFDLQAIKITDKFHENLLKKSKGPILKDCCTYKDLSLNFSWAQNLRKVEGYMQNWRWFYPGETVKLIREEFQFLPTIQQMSNDLIEEAKARWRLGRAERESGKDQMEIDYRLKFADEITDPIIVGIHVRRGLDLTFHYRNMKHGHKAAPRDYYEKTIQYFREKFQQLIFLISSDDLKWAKENLQETKPGEFFFLPRNTEREVGMSVLSSCDHLIISTGTFSWWAAFLADDEKNEIIYYKDWPREDSEMAKMLKKDEYFLPRWKGM